MLALFLAVPMMRPPITVPRNQSRDRRETQARFPFLIYIYPERAHVGTSADCALRDQWARGVPKAKGGYHPVRR